MPVTNLIFNDLLNSEVLADEYAKWFDEYVGSENHGKLRFGQYICNKYLCLGKSAPEIFYEEKVGKAYWLIVDVLVNQEI